jgi:hypothetical protein
MENQKSGIEGFSEVESIREGPMGIFRKIGAKQNLLKHSCLLSILFFVLDRFLIQFYGLNKN